MNSPRYFNVALFTTLCSLTSQQVSASVFDWSDFGSLISDVQAGDSFTAINVDNSGVDFTFTFSQVLDSRTNSSFEVIHDTASLASNSDPGDNGFATGNGNPEGLYTSNPLYLTGQSQWRDDAMIITITTSQSVDFNNFIIGDLDRTTSGNQTNTFEDKVTITAALSGSNVGVALTAAAGSNIAITGNAAEASSGGLLQSNLTASQINVSTNGLVDTLVITYQNADATGAGLSNSNDGLSDSHWITLGNDDRLTEFTAVPEPSSFALLTLGGLAALSRRKR